MFPVASRRVSAAQGVVQQRFVAAARAMRSPSVVTADQSATSSQSRLGSSNRLVSSTSCRNVQARCNAPGSQRRWFATGGKKSKNTFVPPETLSSTTEVAGDTLYTSKFGTWLRAMRLIIVGQGILAIGAIPVLVFWDELADTVTGPPSNAQNSYLTPLQPGDNIAELARRQRKAAAAQKFRDAPLFQWTRLERSAAASAMASWALGSWLTLRWLGRNHVMKIQEIFVVNTSLATAPQVRPLRFTYLNINRGTRQLADVFPHNIEHVSAQERLPWWKVVAEARNPQRPDDIPRKIEFRVDRDGLIPDIPRFEMEVLKGWKRPDSWGGGKSS